VFNVLNLTPPPLLRENWENNEKGENRGKIKITYKREKKGKEAIKIR